MMNTYFSLMNKDNKIIDFIISRDKLSMNVIADKIYNDKAIPLSIKSGYYDLRSWLESRYIMSYRTDIKTFFNTIGIKNLEEFISITHCVSLNDTFWVKPMSSRVTWKGVSPYTNPINKVVANYSFTNKIVSKSITGSYPDFSTDGNFPKCWRRKCGDTFLIKAGTSGACNAGNESFSEIFAYQLAEHIRKYTPFDCIEYKLINYKGTYATECKNICNEYTGLISLRQLTNNSKTDFKWLVENYSCPQIHKMLIFDYLLCNTDRHFGNIWILVDNELQQVKSFASIGDNNLSCIPYYMTDESLEYYIEDIRAKDGRTWKELLGLIDNKTAKEILRIADNFKFKQIGNSKADSRISILNKMLHYQINEAYKVV